MNAIHLTDTVIDDLLVFAYCKDTEIDPDFAVLQLERIAANIQSLEQADLRVFLERVAFRSKKAIESGDSLLAGRLQELPEHLGVG
jgi:hypothetical protein